MGEDSAGGYEDHARDFLRVRDQSTIGLDIVERWARALPRGASVLDIACGGGVPITRALIRAGLSVWALDASPTMVAAFRARFPNTPVECARVQESDCFARQFDAIVCIGLIFLLDETEQVLLIKRIAELLEEGGRFLFTAPVQEGSWKDTITGRESRSLGRAQYEAALQAAGFRLIGRYDDEGNNNHYSAERAE